MGGVVDAIKDAIDDVVSFVGKPFGIYTHDETFTDLQISNLLTPGEANNSARKNARYRSRGSAEVYFKGYRAFQRDYRRKYSADFMKNLGYAPSSSARSYILIESKIKTYIQNLYGYQSINLIEYADKYMSLAEKASHAIRENSGYDYDTEITTINGKEYKVYSYVNGSNESQIIITYLLDPYQAIEDNLVANYQYDSLNSTVIVNGELYSVDINSSNISNGVYTTNAVHIPKEPENPEDPPIEPLPDEQILTSAVYLNDTITNNLYSTEVTFVKYNVTSGEVSSNARYWITAADTVTELYDIATVDVTAIIPLKEDNSMVDLEARKLERMLRRLNLSGEQLRTSITNPDIDSAYLMTAINPQYNDNITNKTLFKVFDSLSPVTLVNGVSTNVSVTISKMNMKYTYEISITNKSGSIGQVGDCVRSNWTSSGMTLRLQQNTTEYQEMVITGFSQTYTISGARFTANLKSTGGYCRIIIPLDLYNSLRYKDWEHIYERALCLLAFATETVEVKWYESGAFGTLLKIVGVVITIISLGTASSLGAALITLASSVVLAVAIKEIAIAIGGELGMIVAAVLTVLYAYNFGGLNSATDWLKTANKALSSINQVIEHELNEFLAKGKNTLEALQKQIDKYTDLNKEFEDDKLEMAGMLINDTIGIPDSRYLGIAAYCSGITTTEVSSLVDYGSQIENAIHIRTNVWSGS